MYLYLKSVFFQQASRNTYINTFSKFLKYKYKYIKKKVFENTFQIQIQIYQKKSIWKYFPNTNTLQIYFSGTTKKKSIPSISVNIKFHINSKISIQIYWITFLISLYIQRLFDKKVELKNAPSNYKIKKNKKLIEFKWLNIDEKHIEKIQFASTCCSVTEILSFI